MELRESLRRYFGFTEFRPGQAAAIEYVLAGRDTLVVMPTGAGKSLIYQLAAVRLPGTALVISPLIALMKDQVDGLNRRNISATCINSGLTSAERAQRLGALAEGRYKIVLVAPERLRSAEFRAALARIAVSLLVVDEAHCISEWGHDFRPDYLHLAEARRELSVPLTLALTATATPRVQDDIVRLLDLGQAERLVTGFNRPNLRFEVPSTPDSGAKLNFIRDLLGLTPDEGGGIIYTGTRRDAEEVADFVREVVGWPALHYHGLLDPASRAEAQDAFLAGKLPLIVATNAFGMGIDRPDVRFVLHYTVPSTLEAYYQEAGRAGRDGRPARAILLYSPNDTALAEFFIQNGAPTSDDLRAVHTFLQDTWRVRLEDVERATGLPQVKARLALEQLELAQALRRGPEEAHGRFEVEVRPLSEAALQAVARQVDARRDQRRLQLDRMVSYAETNACRRRALLDHFGDRGGAAALRCCDNCQARAELPSFTPSVELSQFERGALIVLDTIARLDWQIGKLKLARMLKGSTAQAVARYRQTRHFGKLAPIRLPEIEALIEQLMGGGYLKAVGGDRPVLRLTPRGEAALEARVPIAVKLRAVASPTVRRRQAEHPAASTDLPAQVHALGASGAPTAVPRLILALGDPNGNVRRLAASALGKLRATTAVEPLLALLEHESAPQVRQYAIKALGKIGDPRAWTALERISGNPAEQHYNQTGARIALGVLRRRQTAARTEPPAQQPAGPEAVPAVDPVAAFLTRSHPRPLPGPWLAGWALDFHSRFEGDRASRGTVGQLVYRYKYRGERQLAEELAARWRALLASQTELPQPDAVIAVPPSLAREVDPVGRLAEALALRLAIPALPDALVKTRVTRPQKELTSLAQKRANVAGAFALHRDVSGLRLIVVDDLYDSGATLREVARVLRRGNVAGLVVLTLTRTIHADL